MKKKKPLLPAQRRFLQYIMERHPPVFDRFTKDRILTALKSGSYIMGGMYTHDFNRLRSDYIEEFEIYNG